MDTAQSLHNADNPFNLANLLNTALQTGADRIAATVIPTSAADRSVVTETPGKPNTIPEPTLADSEKSDPLKKYGPLAVGALAVGALAWLANR